MNVRTIAPPVFAGVADHDPIIDAKQVSGLTSIPTGTLRYWASIHEGPASFKLGRRRVYRKSVVLTWLAEQESQSA
ncbi:helix-turn-helix transcriptional regulator [Rhodococcus erythropolis]|uniref:helix-turn-helix transcriptional regulator n=1 Tax=Rhodococcus erythropolis TaxID=1833 RepID=UPI0022266864|nr:helix-turn-helix domain-containing protein [Rhodococcus erythropolis]MCW2295880.1 DNA-binding transcriptional MerR regulator [Rhodococcus erythropolis]